MTGWPLHIMLKLPDTDEPIRFSDLYKKEFGHLPKNFDRHQRAAKASHQLANAADPYGLGLPAPSDRYEYGTSGPGGGVFGSWLK